MAQNGGLSTERTALAWQRTALALAAAAAVMARLTFGRLGGVAVALLVVAMLLGFWVFVQSTRRSEATLETPALSPSGMGTPALLLAAITCILAIVEFAALAATDCDLEMSQVPPGAMDSS